MLKAWCMILTAGKDWNGVPVDDIQQHVADLAAYVQKMEMEYNHSRPYKKKIFPDVPGAEGGDSYRFYLALKNACEGRKFLMTDNGYLGLGPAAMLEDDIVCLLCGSVMSFVLRPIDKGYEVIGEAYVYGIMFEEASSSEIALEQFAMI
ncbi:uncharacterized protein JN550_005533 [Neoarthrinium moseri]|uniref:uncharacterized protein n=1 Tax=Neoarthrinium moseri TaxID=1658444 RepID=UPI001FDCBBD4|nr:uncharacterized protein JN550_005533 [Neoarthrinium moseri]KAI1869943.1 hypothetical protein JN550_005533 [Neoarthrinium moseri]